MGFVYQLLPEATPDGWPWDDGLRPDYEPTAKGVSLGACIQNHQTGYTNYAYHRAEFHIWLYHSQFHPVWNVGGCGKNKIQEIGRSDIITESCWQVKPFCSSKRND